MTIFLSHSTHSSCLSATCSSLPVNTAGSSLSKVCIHHLCCFWVLAMMNQITSCIVCRFFHEHKFSVLGVNAVEFHCWIPVVGVWFSSECQGAHQCGCCILHPHKEWASAPVLQRLINMWSGPERSYSELSHLTVHTDDTASVLSSEYGSPKHC